MPNTEIERHNSQMGNRIHMARRAKQLTQKDLAEACGFPYQVINRVEQGRQDLYTHRLAVIAKHLGVSADYLLGLSEKEKEHGEP